MSSNTLHAMEEPIGYPKRLELKDKKAIQSIQWSADQRYIAGFCDHFYADDTAKNLYVWDSNSGLVVHCHQANDIICDFAWSSNGCTALGLLDGTIEILDQNFHHIKTFKTDMPIKLLAWHPNGEECVSYAQEMYFDRLTQSMNVSPPGKISLWNLASDNEKILCTSDCLTDMSWSSSGNYLALVENKFTNLSVATRVPTHSTIKIVSALDPEKIMITIPESQEIVDLTCSKDMQRFSVLLRDGSFKVYNLSGICIDDWIDVSADQYHLVISSSPDSTYICSGGKQGLKVWQPLKKKKLVQEENIEDGSVVEQAEWAPISPLICALIRKQYDDKEVVIYQASQLYGDFKKLLDRELSGQKRKRGW